MQIGVALVRVSVLHKIATPVASILHLCLYAAAVLRLFSHYFSFSSSSFLPEHLAPPPYKILATRVLRPTGRSVAASCLWDLNLVAVSLVKSTDAQHERIDDTQESYQEHQRDSLASQTGSSQGLDATHYPMQDISPLLETTPLQEQDITENRLAIYICRGFDMVHCGMYLEVSPELHFHALGVDDAAALNNLRKIVLRSTSFNDQFPSNSAFARLSATLFRIAKYFRRGYSF